VALSLPSSTPRPWSSAIGRPGEPAPNCCLIEAPCLLNGGHGASLRQPFGSPSPPKRSPPPTRDGRFPPAARLTTHAPPSLADNTRCAARRGGQGGGGAAAHRGGAGRVGSGRAHGGDGAVLRPLVVRAVLVHVACCVGPPGARTLVHLPPRALSLPTPTHGARRCCQAGRVPRFWIAPHKVSVKRLCAARGGPSASSLPCWRRSRGQRCRGCPARRGAGREGGEDDTGGALAPRTRLARETVEAEGDTCSCVIVSPPTCCYRHQSLAHGLHASHLSLSRLQILLGSPTSESLLIKACRRLAAPHRRWLAAADCLAPPPQPIGVLHVEHRSKPHKHAANLHQPCNRK
jgi:hypothetical protein